MPTSLREKLKALRKQKGLSFDELARLSGASKSYLWELENRVERKPSAEKLVDIARVLDTTTDYLVDENASHRVEADEIATDAILRDNSRACRLRCCGERQQAEHH